MIYCPDRKFAFIHIPKSGGTSICNALCKATPMTTNAPVAPHAGLRDIAGLIGPKWRLASCVRNPYRRMVSVWGWYMRSRGKAEKGSGPFCSLEEAGELWDEAQRRNFEWWLQTVRWNPWDFERDTSVQYIPQVRWLEGIEAYRHHCILRCEEMNRRDGRALFEQWLDVEAWFVKENVGRYSGAPEDHHTRWTRNFVAEVFAEDFDAFGYER